MDGTLFSLDEVLRRNEDYIVPAIWRDQGAAEVHRLVSSMRLRNLRERKGLLEKLSRSKSFAADERKKCAFDLVYWTTRYGWLPNANERTVAPFLPWEAQVRMCLYPFYEDMLKPLNPADPRGDIRNTIIDKPRYMGVSYCYLSGFIWGALFHQYWDGGAPCAFFLAADRKEHLYSKEDQETHFGRMQQIIEAQPRQLLPEPLGKRTFTAFKIAFPENKVIIRGKAAKGSFGRAQRARAVLLDEEAHMADGRATVTSAGDMTNVVVRVSSVNGMENSFAKDMHDHGLNVRRVHFKYTDCPWYDEDWLAKQAENRSPGAFQQEIMVNYRAVQGRAFWAESYSEAVSVVKDVPLLPRSPLYVLIDIGRADGAATIWLQPNYQQGVYNLLGMVYRPEATDDYMIPFWLGRFPEKDRLGQAHRHRSHWHKADQQFVDYLGRVYAQTGSKQYIAGSDASIKTMHSDSLISVTRRRWGINIRPIKITDKKEMIERVRRMSPHFRIPEFAARATPGQYDRTGSSPFNLSDVFFNYRKRINQQTGEVLESGMPVHDQFSNPADALQYGAAVLPLRIPVLSEDERRKGIGGSILRREKPRPEDASVYAHLLYTGR